MDLTSARWDTPEHRAEDNRRIKPSGDNFGPYHDIQMVVDGELASIFGEVARTRWMWATGNDLSKPRYVKNDPWPKSIEPQFYNETGGVAQTLPRYKERHEVREVESIYLHALKKARSSIYIENQYLTSSTIQQALAQKLNDENGPEIVIVLPRMNSGLLEQLVMEPLQSDILDSLYAVDKHKKLGVYCPFTGDENQVAVKVHAKVMIIDDEFFTVGSANLNERSMGLDTECNLVMRLKDNAVRQFRHRLIAHHLGVNTNIYANTESEHHSMSKAVEALSLEQGGLLSESDTRDENALPVDSEMARPLDTSEPSLYDSIMDDYSIGDSSRESFFRFLGFGVTLSALILLALVWRFTPLSEFATPDKLLNWADIIRQLPLAPVLAILAFILGGLIMFPVLLLIILAASIFEPVPAFIISLTGCLLSALLFYALGNLLGHDLVGKVSGSKMHSLSKHLGKHGLSSILVVRILPVAPFSIINLIAGASHIRVGIFILGTILGMAPGIIVMTLFGGQLMNVLRDPRPGPFAILASIILLVIGLGVLLSRRLRRLGKGSEPSSGSEKKTKSFEQ
ncbi:VTT domain-containing protein [Halodesulfovibrio aestuarii]